MPSTIVKLSSSDARAWAHNQPVWLHETGEVARPVTREEQQAISRALERSRKIDHNFRLSLPLHPLQSHRTNRTPASSAPRAPAPFPQLECAFEVVFVGKKRVVTVFHGDLRYANGREVLAARLLADHGECVLHGRNGKCMAVLRDPLISERAPNYGRRVQFSRNPEDAASAERALSRADVSPVQRQTRRARILGSSKPLYSPEQCPNDCRGRRGGGEWALATGARPPTAQEHHPVCKYAAAWGETLEGIATNAVLYDLELGTVARAALPNEISEADEAERRTGIRQVTVAGRLFAVLPSEEAELASKEAHGEALGAEAAESKALGSDALDSEPSAPHAIENEAELTSDDLGISSDEVDEIEPMVLTPMDPRASEGAAADVFSPVPTRTAKASEREAWPSLDVSSLAEQHRQRAEITAQSYLARRAPLLEPPRPLSRPLPNRALRSSSRPSSLPSLPLSPSTRNGSSA